MSKQGNPESEMNRTIRRKTITSFAILIIGIFAAYGGWKWLYVQPKENGLPKPLRTVLKVNEKINSVFYSEKNIAREYLKSDAAENVRVNGNVGLKSAFDAKNWNLIVRLNKGKAADTLMFLTMNDIKSLPKKDVIFNFKCIEGWSQITHWGGIVFRDFLVKYRLGTHSGMAPDPKHPEDLYKYVGLVTPDGAYYVGIDMKSMMQPQTLLSFEMNEKPLPMNQGYPLRLIIPVKYGIKSLKRIGTIFFSDTPPADYWHERGYDYDAAL